MIANVEIRANSLALRVNEWTCLLSASIVEIDPARVPDTTYGSTSIHRAASTTVVREEERAYLELILWPGMCIVERDVESRSVALIVEAQAYLEGRTENLPAGRIPTSDVSIRARGHTA